MSRKIIITITKKKTYAKLDETRFLIRTIGATRGLLFDNGADVNY